MMLREKSFAQRDAYARSCIEAIKQNLEKFSRKINAAQEAIHACRPMYDAQEREKLLYDIIYCGLCFGASDEEYFLYDFEHLSNEQRDEYVTDRVRFRFYQSVNQLSGVKLLNDKHQAYLRFRKYYKRDALKIGSVADLAAFLEFVSKHPRFIVKPNDLYGGKGIYIADVTKEGISTLFATLLTYKGGVIIEELVEQSEQMNRLNDSCLNTVRVHTVYFTDHVEIHFPTLRCGSGGSATDNFCSGGLLALVSPESGKVISPFANHWREFYDRHPDSGICAKEFQYPKWDDACALAKELAKLIPECRVVGWDLAHTENGWVMIEGNGCPQLGTQIVADTGWMNQFNDLQERLLADMEEPCSWDE